MARKFLRLLCGLFALLLLLPTTALAYTSEELLTFPNADPARAADYISYGEAHPTMTAQQVVTFVNNGLHQPFYTNIASIDDPDDTLVLVNKYHALDRDYVPSDLTGLRYGSAGVTLRKEAAEAFDRMAAAARSAGVTMIGLSGYRSYALQDSLYTRYSAQDGQAAADRYSARPGHSEHQTGLAIDVSNGGVYTQFGGTAAHAWAVEHLHEYGFIIRYTKANEWITGYKDEAWHFRYVGVQAATEIYHLGVTLEEYLDRYVYPTGSSTLSGESLADAIAILEETPQPQPGSPQASTITFSNLLCPIKVHLQWSVDGALQGEKTLTLQNGSRLLLCREPHSDQQAHLLSCTATLPDGSQRTWSTVLHSRAQQAFMAGLQGRAGNPHPIWKTPVFRAFI